MTKSVVIVESPAKTKSIGKYLGKDYTVLASFGHIRDLPSKDGSVEPDNDFEMHYQISKDSTKHVKAITDAMKQADKLILATDPDREGEAISWHVLEMLRAKKVVKKDTPVERVAFSSITKSAVTEAIANPRELDMNLVNAQQARRALDYLVGFTLSPVLWRKLPGSKSAGRVQSVALRIICEREEEIEAFNPQEYWSVIAQFIAPNGKQFDGKLTHLNGKKLDKFDIGNDTAAQDALAALANSDYTVTKVEKKESKRQPYAPFTTSTLQQEAARKLSYGAKRTMQVAQKLYEGFDIGGETTGLITYMRTDGIDVAPEAVMASRELIGKRYGDEYLPKSPRMYKSKQKNAQEAHEAIRPTDPKRTPDSLKKYLNDEQYALYDLIWKRMIASQMSHVVLDQVAADIDAGGNGTFRANGSTVRFDGFYKVYREGWDEEPEEADEKTLPPLAEKDAVTLADLEKSEKNPDAINPLANQHFTQPPPRYSEASLVKKLEELSIGRPSTYAAILSVLQERDYVTLDKKRFLPEMRGRLVTKFLESYFPRYVEYDFTANLEDELDTVAEGKLAWKKSLEEFWKPFKANVDGAMEIELVNVLEKLDTDLAPAIWPGQDAKEARKCPNCGTGELHLKLGKFGAFLGCNNYPDCKTTVQIGNQTGEGPQINTQEGPAVLGTDPETGLDITLRAGPYGPYVQLGEPEGKKKPKRASLPKGTNPDDMTLDTAIDLLALPRTVGTHPDTGKDILANNGRYGPYIQHDGVYVNLKDPEDNVLTIGMNRAVTLIAEKAQQKGGKAAALKELGNHPKDSKPISLHEGRYGPYVKHGRTNASLTKGYDADSITLDQAVELLAAKKKKKK